MVFKQVLPIPQDENSLCIDLEPRHYKPLSFRHLKYIYSGSKEWIRRAFKDSTPTVLWLIGDILLDTGQKRSALLATLLHDHFKDALHFIVIDSKTIIHSRLCTGYDIHMQQIQN